MSTLFSLIMNHHPKFASPITRLSSFGDGPVIVELEPSESGSVQNNKSKNNNRPVLRKYRNNWPNYHNEKLALYNRRLGNRPHYIQVSDNVSRLEMASKVPKPWKQVNENVSTKMTVLSSDSPPIIPKRNYMDTNNSKSIRKSSNAAKIDQSFESSDENPVFDQQLVPFQGDRRHCLPRSLQGSVYSVFEPTPFGFWPVPHPPPPPPMFWPSPAFMFAPDPRNATQSDKKPQRARRCRSVEAFPRPPQFCPPPPHPIFLPHPLAKNGHAKQAPKNEKHGRCYSLCCKGHAQILWILVGIVLTGIVVGLVLGLTIV